MLVASLPARASAQSHIDAWTPSLAFAALAHTHGDPTAEAAFDLRLDGLFGDPTGRRGGGFVEGRVSTGGELSAALGATFAAHLTGHDGGTSLMVSAGGALHDRQGLTPAGLVRVWWGMRTAVDARTRYEIAFGLWAEARYLPRDSALDVLFGFSVDPYALALPFIFFGSMLSSR